MHIVDGALTLPVLAAGGAIALGGTALGLKKMDLDEIPRVGLLSAAFFLASLIHVPVGPSSVHLILNGLVGLVLGWTAFPALLVGLLLQAVFFGFGGLVVLGVNVANIAFPAVIVYLLVNKPLSRANNNSMFFILGFLAGSLAVGLTTGLVAVSLAFSGEEFVPAAKLVFYTHLPLMILEGVLVGAAAVLISKVKPDMFRLAASVGEKKQVASSPPLASNKALLGLLLVCFLWAGQANAHNMIFDVYVEGNQIEGEVGYSNGDPAVNIPVTVTDNDGHVLEKLMTDGEGIFVYDVKKKIDLHFEVNAGAGHVAKKSVKAEELGSQSALANDESISAASEPAPAQKNDHIGVHSAQLEEMISKAVAREVKPLRKQLLQYENAVRFRDILGGLGYILGLTGLGLWISTRRQRQVQ